MTDTTPVEKPLPWYRLQIGGTQKPLRLGKFTRVFLAITLPLILLYSVTVAPVWRWRWRVGLYGFSNGFPARASSGRWLPGGAWVRSREIHVYGAPSVSAQAVDEAAAACTSLVDELGLNFTVRTVPTPSDAAKSYQAALVKKGGDTCFDVSRFSGQRLTARGDRYAEVVVVDHTFKQASWAAGLTYYPSGLATVQAGSAIYHFTRHECGHLFGYCFHDDYPLCIFGYSEDWRPYERHTLMHAFSTRSDDLSPRSRDALHNYWRGMEGRMKMRFFRSIE